jgi:uncharacterized membrane protein HdeD (DUF308 family)
MLVGLDLNTDEHAMSRAIAAEVMREAVKKTFDLVSRAKRPHDVVVLLMVVGLLIVRLGSSVGSSTVDPETDYLSLALLLTVPFMGEGFSRVIVSLTIRPTPSRGWVFAGGIMGFSLGFYLWTNTPVAALWQLGVLLGIKLICEGVGLGDLAWRALELIARFVTCRGGTVADGA